MAGNQSKQLKEFLKAQVNSEENWAVNMKILRAAGLFFGSIFLMRNFGDLMAI
ncbi:Mitochondrial import receptor subunit TOM5 like [Apostasia shenzhenica]|uniref:Mitochondrial import receptor subunit TOM5 like n=1 Tax=Apostasia shenzhenica TaxID=1088818 RepID=A0A2I0B9I4_9ASPA|nr:Mitochondrial import receptor subunit TOM5 like [Apostasia shenzhenica]